MTSRMTLVKLLTVTGVVLAVTSTACADDVPSFRKRGDQEKKFASDVCLAVLKAAHFTGVEPKLDRYEYKNPKAGRTELVMKGTFKGKATGKLYTSDIIVVIDSSNKDSWEVLRIEYSDNATVPWSRDKVMELVKKFNE